MRAAWSARAVPTNQPQQYAGVPYFARWGQIEFYAIRVSECDPELRPACTYSYSYKAQAIIDPHGLRTTLTYNSDGSLYKIQEPAGRYIQITYTVLGQIDHVTTSANQEVRYNYSQTAHSPGTIVYTQLDSVVYPFEPALNLSPTAFYTYQAPNGPNPNGCPLLASCDDPMYAGPMKKISYTYATQNGDYSNVAVGQILSENNGNTGQIVSRLYVQTSTWRNEIRGDGPSRRFEYGGAFLQRFIDFQGHYSSILYENGYVSAFTDARNHQTTTQREGPIGAVSVLTHPDPEQSTQRFSYKYVDGAPYFLQIRGDERNLNSNTYFTRDPVTNRVTKIWYPDYPSGPTEEFTYNGFGQIETHTMTSGGVENFRYDSRGLMFESWPPATPSDPNPEQHKTRYFYYTSGPQMDRLWYVIDPRNNTTTFEYNTRGQVTKVTHPGGAYTQNAYNADGTLASTTDELAHTTNYIYDDYKRVVSVTNPLNKTFTLSYAPPNGAGSYSHTTTSVYRATSPLNKIATFDYDENFRRKMVRRGSESPDDDGGTYFGYDEVGNLTSVKDPRGNITTFGYDERNRRTSATAPYPFNNQVTQWEYDTRSNLRKETRPDQSFRRMEYDSLSRVIDTYGFANEHTHYDRDLAGNIWRMIDPKPATYLFDYDKMNRKTGAHYPTDATGAGRSENWHYDFAGNLDQYTNPAAQIKTLTYDNRNRPWDSWWNAGGGPLISTRFDGASRLSSVTTNNGETTVAFGYDDANRQIWEEQTVAGFPTRRVETPRDDDGNRSALQVAEWYYLQYDYTSRNQLRTIYGSSTPWFHYSYDFAGNMIKRQDVWGGVNDSTNVMDGNGVSQYDALNRPMMWEQTGAGNASFARSHFNYDNLGRLKASWRDEQAGKGEWFGYNVTGQLTGVSYNADGVANGTPQNASRTVAYTIAPNTLNRSSMNDNGYATGYTPNALNQYENVGSETYSYDGNFNLIDANALGFDGLSAVYNSANQLVSAICPAPFSGPSHTEDNAQFAYDGLGRCVKRTASGVTELIAYDGWKPILEWDEWGNFKAWNVYGAGPDEILYRRDATGGDMRYHLDRMGNVAFLLDADGDGIEKYTYDAFGKPTVTDWNGDYPRPYSLYGNPFMFAGREYFPGLGLYDYRNRFYHPGIGRFLQKDPIGFRGRDANLFRYCGGDPVNRRDPFGLTDSDTIYTTDVGATTERVVVTAPEVPGYDRTAGDGHRDIGALDRTGAASGERGSRDGGGSGHGSRTPGNPSPNSPNPSSPSPTPQPSPSVPPTPAPPARPIMPEAPWSSEFAPFLGHPDFLKWWPYYDLQPRHPGSPAPTPKPVFPFDLDGG